MCFLLTLCWALLRASANKVPNVSIPIQSVALVKVFLFRAPNCVSFAPPLQSLSASISDPGRCLPATVGSNGRVNVA